MLSSAAFILTVPSCIYLSSSPCLGFTLFWKKIAIDEYGFDFRKASCLSLLWIKVSFKGIQYSMLQAAQGTMLNSSQPASQAFHMVLITCPKTTFHFII